MFKYIRMAMRDLSSDVYKKCETCRNILKASEVFLKNNQITTACRIKVRSEYTAKNTVISPDFLVWKFCGKAQFPHNFGRFARNYAETVPLRKIPTPGNQVKLRYFSQWHERGLALRKSLAFIDEPVRTDNKFYYFL